MFYAKSRICFSFNAQSMARKRHSKIAKRSTRRKSKVSKRTKSHFATALLRLKKLPKGRQVQAIGMANDRFIRSLCSHVKKLKHAKLSARSAASLRRHRKKLHTLMNSRVSVKRKRQILTQRGGGIISSILGNLAGIVLKGLNALHL